jgi:hypothetical protein
MKISVMRQTFAGIFFWLSHQFTQAIFCQLTDGINQSSQGTQWILAGCISGREGTVEAIFASFIFH